jgi:hypothetical protein
MNAVAQREPTFSIVSTLPLGNRFARNAQTRYYRRARIHQSTFLFLIRCFAGELSATETAALAGVT